MTKKPLNVVVSYSHKDEAFRQQLETALKPLVREGLISLWSDHRINAGSEIDHEIQLQLKKADVILLLVSPDFLNSDYCYCIEMELAIDRHNNDLSVVIPIILRHSDWTKTPFSGLKALPNDGKPVFSWSDRDEAWLFVIKGIRGTIENLLPKLAVIEEKSKKQSKTIRESLTNGFNLLRDQYEAP
jgi:TIR domain